MKHELKILPKYFEAVNCGKKNFEIRINDRNYQEDDELILKEWERGKYTGRECRRWVGYIYHGDGTYGIAENTVIMALKRSAPTACLDNDTADCKTENSSEKPNNSTRSKMEQVDKDINVRSKDEPYIDIETGILHWCGWKYKRTYEDEPQTERTCDNCGTKTEACYFCDTGRNMWTSQTDCGWK